MSENKPSVLVVDDTPSNIELLDRMLGEDYEVLFAVNGLEGVATALAEQPDLILLDVMMPEMDGFDTCRQLKADRRTAEIPVIFITALDQEAEETRGLELGAIDFIAKPFRPAVVCARIRNHIRLKRQGDLLRNLSFMDGLTGIPNRRRFDQVLDAEWRRSTRNRTPVSLIMMDLDFFKAYNDALGHIAGDDCLRRIAQGLADLVHRPGDVMARFGGEEFVCVLCETDADGAALVAAAIHATVADLAIPHPTSTLAPMVTVSLGVATVALPSALEAGQLILAADRALYEAKAAGRNCSRSTFL